MTVIGERFLTILQEPGMLVFSKASKICTAVCHNTIVWREMGNVKSAGMKMIGSMIILLRIQNDQTQPPIIKHLVLWDFGQKTEFLPSFQEREYQSEGMAV
jgi:hypothetical protein